MMKRSAGIPWALDSSHTPQPRLRSTRSSSAAPWYRRRYCVECAPSPPLPPPPGPPPGADYVLDEMDLNRVGAILTGDGGPA